MSIYAKTGLTAIPGSCAECVFGERYGLVGDVYCKILGEYFTGNVKPPHKMRPDECPLVELPASMAAQLNEPLTLEELKQMYCQPVWVRYEDGIHGSWGLVELDQITLPAGAYCIIREDSFGTGWKAYRRPPKEEA